MVRVLAVIVFLCFGGVASAADPQAKPEAKPAIGAVSPAALARLARSGPVADRATALEKLREAADKNDPEAWFQLGNCLEHGWGAAPDVPAVTKLYERASARKHAGAVIRRAHLKLAGDDIHDRAAIEFLVAASDQGIGEASWVLGWAHEYFVLQGDENTWNDKKPLVAKTWLRRLTDLDDPLKRAGLAHNWGLHRTGTPTASPTPKNSLRWYEKGAASGELYSRLRILLAGPLYQQIERIAEINKTDELRTTLKGADPRAMAVIAAAYFNTRSMIKREDFEADLWKEAVPSLQKLADADDEWAQRMLHFYHYRYLDDGDRTYLNLADSLFRRRAEAGDVDAQAHLGQRLSRQDPAAGEKWYRVAAAAGHPMAQLWLAQRLTEKKDDQSAAEAKRWESLAAEQQLKP